MEKSSNNILQFEGWAEQVRFASKGKLAFVDLYQGGSPSNIFPIVISGSKEDIKQLGLTRHCSLRVKGKISQGENQIELHATPDQVTVIGKCDPDSYPIVKKAVTLDYLRSIPQFRPRTKLFRAVFRIRSLVTRAIHKFFSDYTYVHTPLITKSDCEGAGETFEVTAPGCPDFFGSDKGYLTVSGQLQGEILAAALGPIYTFGPTFRAEKSNTSRHLSEFIMMEPEIPFSDLNDIINISIDLLKYIVEYVTDKGESDESSHEVSSLEILDDNNPGLIDKLTKFVKDDPVIMT